MASTILSYLNQELIATLNDGREMRGTFIAYDKYMNIILADVTETYPISSSSDNRKFGLLMIRGEHIVSIRTDTN